MVWQKWHFLGWGDSFASPARQSPTSRVVVPVSLCSALPCAPLIPKAERPTKVGDWDRFQALSRLLKASFRLQKPPMCSSLWCTETSTGGGSSTTLAVAVTDRKSIPVRTLNHCRWRHRASVSSRGPSATWRPPLVPRRYHLQTVGLTQSPR